MLYGLKCDNFGESGMCLIKRNIVICIFGMMGIEFMGWYWLGLVYIDFRLRWEVLWYSCWVIRIM